jgi:carbamoyl-phosphate synthase large subunit
MESADPVLRVEMSSTGEVACLGETAEEAYLKSFISTGFSMKDKSALITVGGEENKLRFAESVWRMKNLGFTLYATHNTHHFLKSQGVRTRLVSKVYENKKPNVVDIIKGYKVSLVINISDGYNNDHLFNKHESDGYLIRRASIDNNIPLITDLNAARFFVNAIHSNKFRDLKIKSWEEYI